MNKSILYLALTICLAALSILLFWKATLSLGADENLLTFGAFFIIISWGCFLLFLLYRKDKR